MNPYDELTDDEILFYVEEIRGITLMDDIIRHHKKVVDIKMGRSKDLHMIDILWLNCWMARLKRIIIKKESE